MIRFGPFRWRPSSSGIRGILPAFVGLSLLFSLAATDARAANSMAGFTRVYQTDGTLIVSARFKYNGAKGDKVFVGAYALDGRNRKVFTGYRPWMISRGSGRVYVQLRYTGSRQLKSKKIRLTMYVGGRAPFYSKVFNLKKTWKKSKDLIKAWTFRSRRENAKDLTFSIRFDLNSSHSRKVRMGAMSLRKGKVSRKHGFGPSKRLKRGKNKSTRARLSYIKSSWAKSDAILVGLYEEQGKYFSLGLVPRVKYWSKKKKDRDHDGISDVVEAALRTNPRKKDTDGDGLRDGWELEGYRPGGYVHTNTNLPLMGVHPRKKDLLLEIDWMKTSGHNHKPRNGALTTLRSMMASAPVSNPGGSNGIRVYIDVNGKVPHQNEVDFGSGSPRTFSKYKKDYFSKRRKKLFHYILFAHKRVSTTSSGRAEILGNDVIVSLGAFTGQIGTLNQQTGTLIHELGHNLNIRHGGNENRNNKPNYVSVMNYDYQFRGVDTNCNTTPDGVFRYSRGRLAALNEARLNEPRGMCNSVAIDWNGNGSSNQTGLRFDINGDGGINTIRDHNDWGRLRLDFQGSANAAD